MTTFNVQGNEAVPIQEEAQGSGYLGATSPVPTEYSQQQQAQQGSDLQLVNELQEKLGVNLNDVPQQQAVPQAQPQAPEVQQQEDFVKKFNSVEGQRMRNEFKQIMGIDPLEAFQAVQNTNAQLREIENWRRQVSNEKQIETLQNEWGGEFEETWSAVREKFQTLPDNMKQALDGIEGARLLAAQIRLERGSGQQRSVQQFQKSSYGNHTQNIRTSGNAGGYIRTSDYLADKVSESDYIQAVRSNRVINDV
jgi:hypothetical protein